MNGDCSSSYDNFNNAIGFANKGVKSRDIFQEGVDIIFSSGEYSKRVNYQQYVGTFFYNRGMLSHKLGNEIDAQEDIASAIKLNYLKEEILNIDSIFCK